MTLQAERDDRRVGKLFPAGPIGFDSLAARVSWTFPQGDLLVRLDDVAFANADLAGSIFGTYRGDAKGSRGVDLTGDSPASKATGVPVHSPAGRRGGDWLKHRLQAGTASEARWRFRGDPRRLPVPRPGARRVQDQRPGDRWDARVRRRLAEAHQRPPIWRLTADAQDSSPRRALGRRSATPSS